MLGRASRSFSRDSGEISEVVGTEWASWESQIHFLGINPTFADEFTAECVALGNIVILFDVG
jgi:hypothetical protein